jgi:hypothetical protein
MKRSLRNFFGQTNHVRIYMIPLGNELKCYARHGGMSPILIDLLKRFIAMLASLNGPEITKSDWVVY